MVYWYALSDAGHEFTSNTVVTPAVQYWIDARRSSHRQHLETEVQQAEQVDWHGGTIELDDQREDVPRQPERDEVGYDERQQARRPPLTSSGTR